MRVFRYTPLDGLLVSLPVVELALRTGVVVAFGAIPWWGLALGLVALVYLNCTNYQCSAHYFIHAPYFAASPLNAAFGIMNSLALMMPQSIYSLHHLNHHRYGNDFRADAAGTTNDRSSIYCYGPSARTAENPWHYALLSPFRQRLGVLIAEVIAARLRRQLFMESAAIAVYVVVLAKYASLLALAFGAVSIYFGLVAAALENWAEHAGARPGSRLTDAVSCYGKHYNTLWFNNGYHQEHHYRPSVHWTKLPRLRGRMLPETDRHVVAAAHIANVFGLHRDGR